MPDDKKDADVQVNVETNPAPPHGPERPQDNPPPDAGGEPDKDSGE